MTRQLAAINARLDKSQTSWASGNSRRREDVSHHIALGVFNLGKSSPFLGRGRVLRVFMHTAHHIFRVRVMVWNRSLGLRRRTRTGLHYVHLGYLANSFRSSCSVPW
jgi:hypothetical protein